MRGTWIKLEDGIINLDKFIAMYVKDNGPNKGRWALTYGMGSVLLTEAEIPLVLALLDPMVLTAQPTTEERS